MANFTGQLRSNEIFSALYNMIISQEVFADNIGKHQTLVDKARVDGGLYGDTKLYYATDVLKSQPWGNDAEAANLLALDRPSAPACQAIVLDQFRQIRLTVDNYLSKRAWADEGAFSSFNGIMLGWIRETKRIYDGTLYNVFIGTTVTTEGKQSISIDLGSTSGHPLYNLTGVEKEQMEAMIIAQALADLMVEMGDYSRDFNDYGFLRSYSEGDIKVIWNSEYVNKIRKIDLPTIFHKDGLVDKFDEEVLPARYFGTTLTAATVTAYSNSSDTANYTFNSGAYLGANAAHTIRTNIEAEANVSGTLYHVFPGDELPTGATVANSSANFTPGETYEEDDDVICKVVTKLPPYMSAFEVGTSFFNPRSLTENHYLTFGYNTLEYLKNYPFITVKASK